ncbi:MAG TPA: Fe-S cluster assembly protein SufD [Bacteroidales bacterium]|jgi:Fe-S cluster assembly protein SufD|nr:Fe-S cluster assembly protein SufD [Bacteroidales bacterium]HPK29531.1 Fe-S cluster assembly protein SufD [Bacteroidales bacterium]
MKQNYIYAPNLTSEFKCKVPLQGTRQLFIVNGRVQGGRSPFSLRLEEGEAMEEILQIISVRHKSYKEELSTQQDFHFGKGSVGRIIQCSHTFSPDRFVTTEKVTITVEKDASAEFCIMQNEHNNAEHNTLYEANLAEGASLNMVFLSLHGGIIRNEIVVNLNGSHAQCDLAGLYLTDSRQLMDNNIHLNHLVPYCTSSQLFKGILDDEGVARFYGLIKVAPDAQKTEAYQANHNLLISDKAKAHTKPQLEIYADDVKCSHGATMGRLNEDELFYMRTRGIPAAEARILQQKAFAHEVLEKISNTQLRERMLILVERRLRGEFSHCKNCTNNCC